MKSQSNRKYSAGPSEFSEEVGRKKNPYIGNKVLLFSTLLLAPIQKRIYSQCETVVSSYRPGVWAQEWL